MIGIMRLGVHIVIIEAAIIVTIMKLTVDTSRLEVIGGNV